MNSLTFEDAGLGRISPERCQGYRKQRLGVLGILSQECLHDGGKEAVVVEVQGWMAKHFRNGVRGGWS